MRSLVIDEVWVMQIKRKPHERLNANYVLHREIFK